MFPLDLDLEAEEEEKKLETKRRIHQTQKRHSLNSDLQFVTNFTLGSEFYPKNIIYRMM